jgi:hypothetical protein
MRQCNAPTVKTILARLQWLDKVGDPGELAQRVRAELEKLTDRPITENRLQYIFSGLDKTLQTHGTDYAAHRDDDQHGTHGLTYINTGDSYTATVIYNHKTGTLSICAVADIVERHPNEYP